MSHTLELLPDEPILFQTWSEDFDFGDTMIASVQDTIDILDTQTEPVFFITDMLAIRLDVHDLVTAANYAGRGSVALFHHENVREVIFVTSNTLIKAGAKGMNNPVFGNVAIAVFDTADKAIAYAREQIAAS